MVIDTLDTILVIINTVITIIILIEVTEVSAAMVISGCVYIGVFFCEVISGQITPYLDGAGAHGINLLTEYFFPFLLFKPN